MAFDSRKMKIVTEEQTERGIEERRAQLEALAATEKETTYSEEGGVIPNPRNFRRRQTFRFSMLGDLDRSAEIPHQT
jgi:hypothetical protein